MIHPLLASQVLARSGLDPAPDEAGLLTECPSCGRGQSLAEAVPEPAEDPQDITAYRCVTGCTVLVVTGYPNPMPIPGSGRYRFGDFVLAPLVPFGVMVRMPSGRQIRLAPSAGLSQPRG